MAQIVKNPPAMQETWVQSLGWDDPLEKKMATHSSILAWRIPWTEEPGGLWSTGSQSEMSKVTEHTRLQKLQIPLASFPCLLSLLWVFPKYCSLE